VVHRCRVVQAHRRRHGTPAPSRGHRRR
jgi:hypothetical protein